jgi:hypothetical protein
MRRCIQILQCRQRLFRYIPLAEDFVDDPGGEPRTHETPHYARHFFLVRRLANALAVEVFAGKCFFVCLAVAGGEGLGDEVGVDALLLQVLADAADAELLVLLA